MIYVLERLREKKKKLFIATNSDIGYAKLVMEATLGPDWRKYFDLILTDCGKPNFFSEECVKRFEKIEKEPSGRDTGLKEQGSVCLRECI